jgi:TolB protein
MDVAIFSPDGQWIIFSASGQPNSLATPVGNVGVTDWFGKGIAKDGNIPSDLWRVPVQGGPPQRLTNQGEFSLYPAFSPDGNHVVILAAYGIYLMNADGTDLQRLTDSGGVGTVNWVP